MKKLLLPLLILCAFAASAQTPLPGSTLINSRYKWLGGKFDQLKIPMYADTTQYPLWLPRVGGDMMLDTAGADQGVIYVRYNQYWHGVSGNGGTGDTTGYKYFSAQYPLILNGSGDTAYLSIDTSALGGGGGALSDTEPYSLKGNGVGSQAALVALMAAQGTAPRTIVIDTLINVTSTLTIPSHITLIMGAGRTGFSSTASFNVNFNGPVYAANSQFIYGLVNMIPSRNAFGGPLNVRWFGVHEDSTDCLPYFVKAGAAAAGSSSRKFALRVPTSGDKSYKINGTWSVPQSITVWGDGWQSTTIEQTADTATILLNSGTDFGYMRIYGNGLVGRTGVKAVSGNRISIHDLRIEQFSVRGLSLDGPVQNSHIREVFSQQNAMSNFYVRAGENLWFTGCNGNTQVSEGGTVNSRNFLIEGGRNIIIKNGIFERGEALHQFEITGNSSNVRLEGVEINNGSLANVLVRNSTATMDHVQFSNGGNYNVMAIGLNTKVNVVGEVATSGANGRLANKLYYGNVVFNGNQELVLYTTNMAGSGAGSNVGGASQSYDSLYHATRIITTQVASGIGIGGGTGSGYLAPGQQMGIRVNIADVTGADSLVSIFSEKTGSPSRILLARVPAGDYDFIMTAPDSLRSLRIGLLKGSSGAGSFVVRKVELYLPTPLADTIAGRDFSKGFDTTLVWKEVAFAKPGEYSINRPITSLDAKTLLDLKVNVADLQWRDTIAGIYRGSGIVSVGPINSSSTAKLQVNNTTGNIAHLGDFLANSLPFIVHKKDTLTAANIGSAAARLGQLDRRVLLSDNGLTLTDISGMNTSMFYRAKDSTRLYSLGGDLIYANKSNLVLGKYPGFTGRTVFQGGTVDFDAVPAQLSEVSFNGSGIGNPLRLRGWWAGHTSYLITTSIYDTIDNFIANLNGGYNGAGARIGNYYGNYQTGGLSTIDSNWGAYYKGANVRHFMQGKLGIGSNRSVPAYNLDIEGTMRFVDGNQGSGKVLTSDADGVATWQTAGGGGGAAANTNLGSGYRLVVPSTQEIKTGFAGYGILKDSTTNTNGITDKLDTAVVFPALRATIVSAAGPAAATATEVNTGTDNSKIPTALALQGSEYEKRDGSKNYALTAGTATVLTAAFTPVFTTLTTGMSIIVKLHVTNSGSTTITVDGNAAKNIVKLSGTAIVNVVSNDLPINSIVELRYNGTQFQVVSFISDQLKGNLASTNTWTAAQTFSAAMQVNNTITSNSTITGNTISSNGGRVNTGSFAHAYSAKTAAYTLLAANDNTITADATTAAFNVTLPTAVGNSGLRFTVKRINSGANAVTMVTTSSQTIDGLSTFVLNKQFDDVTVMSDGANWRVIDTYYAGMWNYVTNGINYAGGNVGINVATPTAKLHLPSGTATAGTAPLKLDPGTLLSSVESGAVETDNQGLYYTNSSGIRGRVQMIRVVEYNTTGSISILADNYTDYIYTATGATTWTLPIIANSTNARFTVKNAGTGNITLNTNGGTSDLYTTTSVNTMTITPGQSFEFIVGTTKIFVN